MTALALLFTLSAIGISEMVYLIRKRVASEKPFCVIGESCEVVLKSKYSKIFIIPNDILALANGLIIAMISSFLVLEIPPLNIWTLILKILVGIASLLSLFFTYLQWQVIKAWCFWCVMSACTIWLMGIIILLSPAI